MRSPKSCSGFKVLLTSFGFPPSRYKASIILSIYLSASSPVLGHRATERKIMPYSSFILKTQHCFSHIVEPKSYLSWEIQGPPKGRPQEGQRQWELSGCWALGSIQGWWELGFSPPWLGWIPGCQEGSEKALPERSITGIKCYGKKNRSDLFKKCTFTNIFHK